MPGPNTHLNPGKWLGPSALLLSSCLLAVEPPAGTVTALNNVGLFDGTTGLLTSCVALLDANDKPQLDANGAPRIFDAVLSLNRANLVFKLQTATPFNRNAGKDCSGVFKNGIYTDKVLIRNLGAAYNGFVLGLTLDYLPNTNLEFSLRTDSANFGVNHAEAAAVQ
jgi:hypothetical protein